jgi:acetyltransferase
VSIGDQLDVDFGDLLDYFALDRHARRSCFTSRRSRMPESSCRRLPASQSWWSRQAGMAGPPGSHHRWRARRWTRSRRSLPPRGLLRVLDLGELFDALNADIYKLLPASGLPF